MRDTNNWMELAAFILTIIGAVNWGLIGTANFDLVKFIFGELTLMSRIIYSLVGASGIYLIATNLYTIFTVKGE
ncbi:hypothetical protein I862_00870 [endosymbiont of Acanthamoeba sp. UWC8]|uniref:DUF378 domain-containing protein n=1 Tax=endosymbiont of Acanthamoeba sp. UWC8 TaxID=86106 RepID=UPI0004D1C53B|nr:DUF378 domain-containing protein [endosymbiont of Acanthamoeba sp. UWC8]AIF80739.1 hypothetical protein I862_00870 [endosymbiont of Acanthamoeba sp. UWC8]